MPNYDPDIFSFNIEIHLLRTIFHLCSAIVEGMDHVDMVSGGASGYGSNYPGEYGMQYTHGAFGAVNSSTLLGQGSSKFKYDVEFWKRIPDTLCNAQQYIAKTIGRMINNPELYSKGIVNLNMFCYCGESGVHSIVSNTIFPPSTTTDLHKTGFAAMEMSYLALILLIQHFDDVEKNIKLHANEAVKRCKIQAANSLNDYERINRHTMTIQPSTTHKASVSLGQQSARRFEDTEERNYLAFIRKYFPHL